ncbi:MAG: ankyrin repeat domain-containing protein [bacterium]|nr:ankyrin repeat domain-containing protein [bacterium]
MVNSKSAVWIISLLLVFVFTAYGMTAKQAKIELKKINIEYSESEFLYRAKEGDTTAVSLFLDAGMNPNVKDKYGWTALMYAIWGEGHAIPPNPEEKFITIPISIPPEITKRYIVTIKALLKKGAEVNAKTNDGKTAMWVARNFGSKDVVQLLKDAGAKDDIYTKDTYVIGTGAVVDFMGYPYYFRPDRVKALQELYSMKIEYSESAFLKSVVKGNTKVVALFLDAGMNPYSKDKYSRTALQIAKKKKYIEIIQLLNLRGVTE